MCKLLPHPYVLFFSNDCHVFFDGSKLLTLFLCRKPQETFVASLVLIGQPLPEEKSFLEIVNDDGRQVMVIAQ